MSPNAQPVRPELNKDRLHPIWIWGLTLFIVFHLSVLLLTPNSENYFGYRLRPWFQPYVSFFEFSGDWKFFSPDPAPKLELEWSVLDQSGAVVQAGKYPDFENPFIIADRGLRRVASLRFMLMREGSLKKMWVPYLCHHYPHAFSVRMSRVFESPPLLGEVFENKKDVHDQSGLDRSDLGMEFCES